MERERGGEVVLGEVFFFFRDINRGLMLYSGIRIRFLIRILELEIFLVLNFSYLES